MVRSLYSGCGEYVNTRDLRVALPSSLPVHFSIIVGSYGATSHLSELQPCRIPASGPDRTTPMPTINAKCYAMLIQYTKKPVARS
jgi:hypothetical protein